MTQLLTDYFAPGVPRDASSVRDCYAAIVRLATSKEREVRLQFHHNVIVETHSRGGFGTGNSIDELNQLVEEGDLVFAKHRASCFYNTNLELELRMRGIDTLIVSTPATRAVPAAIAARLDPSPVPPPR